MKKVFLSKVVMEDDQTVMLYTQDFIKELDLHENEIFKWELNADGSWTVTRLGVLPQKPE